MDFRTILINTHKVVFETFLRNFDPNNFASKYKITLILTPHRAVRRFD